MTRLRHALITIAGAAALTAGLAACHYLGVAHAAGSEVPAVDAVSAAGDVTWDLAVKDGLPWAALLIVSGLLRTFLDKQHWLAQGKVLSGLTGLSLVIAAVLAWHFAGAPVSGILTALFAAYTLVTHSTVPGAQPKPAGGSGSVTQAGTIGALLLIVGISAGAMTPGCSPAQRQDVRDRVANGTVAFMECEAPHVDATMLADATTLAKEAVFAAISGDGQVDGSRLRADAAPLKSDLLKCAMEAAIAAIATHGPKQAGAAMAAGLEPDGAALRASWAKVRVELGWAPVRPAAQGHGG